MEEEEREEEEMEEEEEEELTLAEKWNQFLDLLIGAREVWETQLRGAGRNEIELLGGKGKILAVYRGASFDAMLSRLVDYYRGYGGLGVMKINIEKKEGEDDA